MTGFHNCLVPLLCHLLLFSLHVAGNRLDTLREIFGDNNYDKAMPPTYDEETPTNVTVQMYLTNIHNVRESQMEFSVDMFFRQSWLDTRLQYNSTNFKKKLEIDLATMGKIWTPDTYFSNAKVGRLHDITVPNRMMHIQPDGAVLYSIHLSIVFNCSMDLSHYPLDDQTCPIRIESYAYSADVVNFIWHPAGAAIVSQTIAMPTFSYNRHVFTNRCDTFYTNVGLFSCIEAHVRFQRKIGYFVVQVFIPSILIVALSWVSFWIDHESVPARISLGLLTVLTMTTQSSSLKEVLPRVSYVKAMDVWMAACLLFVFLALLEYAAVNQLATCHTRKKTESPAATTMEKLRAMDGTTAARKLDRVSRVIFPVCFLSFNAAFWTYYLSTGREVDL